MSTLRHISSRRPAGLSAVIILFVFILLPLVSGCGGGDDSKTGTTSTVRPDSGGGSESTSTGATTTKPKLVDSKSTEGPCENGRMEIKVTYTYDDGTTSSSVHIEPCP